MSARSDAARLYTLGCKWAEAAEWAVFCRNAAALMLACGRLDSARRMSKQARAYAREARMLCGGGR